jgi:hypothetical protein
MELDPLYCDVIVSRYEKFSGKQAERVTACSDKRDAEATTKACPQPTPGS